MAKALKADYGDETPEQVAQAVLKHRPTTNRSSKSRGFRSLSHELIDGHACDPRQTEQAFADSDGAMTRGRKPEG